MKIYNAIRVSTAPNIKTKNMLWDREDLNT